MRRNRRRKPAGLTRDTSTDVLIRRTPFAATVPSALDYFDFDVHCTVVWSAPPGWQEAARQAVAFHTSSRLSDYPPNRWQLAGTHLAAELATVCQLAEKPLVRVWAEDLVVTVESRQLELAEQHAQRLRERQLLDAEHDVERAELRYLRNNVFTDTASAALWWLRHNDYDVTRLNSVTKDLKSTVALVEGNAEQYWADTIITVFDALAPNLNQNGRYELHRNLAQIIHGLGEKEKAEILQSRADKKSADEQV